MTTSAGGRATRAAPPRTLTPVPYAAPVAASADALPFLDHGGAEFAADPHGCLRRARDRSPIVRTPTGVGVLTYDGCSSVIGDPDFRPGVFEMMRRAAPN